MEHVPHVLRNNRSTIIPTGVNVKVDFMSLMEHVAGVKMDGNTTQSPHAVFGGVLAMLMKFWSIMFVNVLLDMQEIQMDFVNLLHCALLLVHTVHPLDVVHATLAIMYKTVNVSPKFNVLKTVTSRMVFATAMKVMH